MAILKRLRRFFKRSETPHPMEVVREQGAEAGLDDKPLIPSSTILNGIENEIDLSGRPDLEDYARSLNASKASIERWISSGLLMPEELKVAEKLLKLIRKH